MLAFSLLLCFAGIPFLLDLFLLAFNVLLLDALFELLGSLLFKLLFFEYFFAHSFAHLLHCQLSGKTSNGRTSSCRGGRWSRGRLARCVSSILLSILLGGLLCLSGSLLSFLPFALLFLLLLLLSAEGSSTWSFTRSLRHVLVLGLFLLHLNLLLCSLRCFCCALCSLLLSLLGSLCFLLSQLFLLNALNCSQVFFFLALSCLFGLLFCATQGLLALSFFLLLKLLLLFEHLLELFDTAVVLVSEFLQF